MQGLGLIGLLFGLALVWVASSLSGYIAGGAVIMMSGASGFGGAVLLRANEIGIGVSNERGPEYLILGTGLMFLGAGLIAGSNMAFQYWISDVENIVDVDVGATVSACGCVLAAYSFFVLRTRRRSRIGG